MDFVALDVETANTSRDSICQIGFAVVRGGQIITAKAVFVDPEQRFDNMVSRIHGLSAVDTQGAQPFPRIHAFLSTVLAGQVLVAHSGFDRTALAAACQRYKLPWVTPSWVDSTDVAADAFPDCPSLSLPVLAPWLGITHRAHDAGEDARATAEVMIAALLRLNRPISNYVQTWHPPEPVARPARPAKPIWPISRSAPGDPEGRFHGQGICFTGELSIEREIAQASAVRAGFNIKTSVTRKCHVLVCGQGSDAPSGKLKAAHKLREDGHPIVIVDELGFNHILAQAGHTG